VRPVEKPEGGAQRFPETEMVRRQKEHEALAKRAFLSMLERADERRRQRFSKLSIPSSPTEESRNMQSKKSAEEWGQDFAAVLNQYAIGNITSLERYKAIEELINQATASPGDPQSTMSRAKLLTHDELAAYQTLLHVAGRR